MSDHDFVRHTIPLVFDVPAAHAEANAEQVADVLNAATGRIFDLISADAKLQALLDRMGVEWGWGESTWEA